MAVEFFTTSTPSTAVQRTESSRLQQLLDAKKVAYTTVRGERERERERWGGDAWRKRGSRAHHGLLSSSLLPSTQVNLAVADRDARDRMETASGGVKTIPQLHVGGKVRVCV